MCNCPLFARLSRPYQGGPTIIKLQYLLKQGYFGGRDHPDMILSITTSKFPNEKLSGEMSSQRFQFLLLSEVHLSSTLLANI